MSQTPVFEQQYQFPIVSSSQATPIYPSLYYVPAPAAPSHDPLTQKLIQLRDLCARDIGDMVTQGGGYFFAKWLVDEVNAVAAETRMNKKLEYVILISEYLDPNILATVKANLERVADKIQANVTIKIDSDTFSTDSPKLAPVYVANNSHTVVADPINKQSVKLVDLMKTFKAKNQNSDENIVVDLTISKQIDYLSKCIDNPSIQSKLTDWKDTLATLWKKAKGNEIEKQNVKEYLQKTQAIIRSLSQDDKSGLENAIKEFNNLILPLSEKDKTFKTGIAFTLAIVATVFFGVIMTTIILSNPATLIFLPLLAIPALVGYFGGAKYADKQINEAKSPGIVATALAKVGLFQHTPHKRSARDFSECAESYKTSDSTPPTVPSVLTPVYN